MEGKINEILEKLNPIDIAAGVEPYQRLSDGVSGALVEAPRS